MSSDIISLAKPRMVLGNLLAALAGFLYAGLPLQPWNLLLMLAGLGLIIGSGCVFNNIYDRGIDARMERTKSRALPAKRVSIRAAFLFGSALFALGFLLLYVVGILPLLVALGGFFSYVFLYTPIKHISGHALWVGAVAGAAPPVVGYAAAAGVLDVHALILFTLLFAWQIPHFISIALYRFEEYKAARVPLIVKVGPKNDLERQRARKLFRISLIVLLVLCVALPASRYFSL